MFGVRRPWQDKHFKFKDLLIQDRDPNTEEFKALCETLVARLKADKRFETQWDLIENFEMLSEIEEVTKEDLEEFNYNLKEMYDFCDNVRIWVD